MSVDKPYQKVIFPNGSRLILVPMEGVESVATAVMVNVGSRFETPAINGSSHFLEHMVFKGTKKFPTTDDVNFIERLGGLQNAYTDIDVTSYHNKVLSTDWISALEINKELALYPRLLEKHVEKERDVILEEMKRYEDEPSVKVSEVFHHMMYPGTKLGMKIIGEEESLKKTTAKTLRNYHDEWYVPERTVVVMAGKMNNETMKQCESTVSEWFGSLPKKTTKQEEVVHEAQEKPAVSIVRKPDAQQAHLTLGLRICNRRSSERYSWSVFNLLFGVSFTSRLFREIREKRGLCYTIRSSSDSWNDVGYWSIYAGVATEKVGEAVSGIMEELKKVVDKGVTNEEVRIAKKRLMTIVAFKSEDPEYMGEWYGRQELYHMPILSIDDYLEKITAVSRESINALVRKYIVQKTLNLALVWNRPKDEKLVNLLQV